MYLYQSNPVMENKFLSPQLSESPKKPEKEGSQEKLVFSEQERQHLSQEFFGISEEEFFAFKKRIERNKGNVRIFVHPFYISRYPEFYANKIDIHGYEETNPEVAAQELETGFWRTLQNVTQNTDSAPLIIFEDEDCIEETRKHILKKFGVDTFDFTKQGILFSATGKNWQGSATGAPSKEGIAQAYKKVRHVDEIELTYEDTLQVFRDTLTPLDIKAGTMGGAYFLESVRSLDRLAACAGTVRQIFNSLDIPINLSRYSVTPREQLKEHYRTKQTRT